MFCTIEFAISVSVISKLTAKSIYGNSNKLGVILVLSVFWLFSIYTKQITLPEIRQYSAIHLYSSLLKAKLIPSSDTLNSHQ